MFLHCVMYILYTIYLCIINHNTEERIFNNLGDVRIQKNRQALDHMHTTSPIYS